MSKTTPATEIRPVNRKFSTLWHGGDYNPDQWPDATQREDIRLMKLAGVNIASVAIFAWAQIEPAPDKFTWDWLDRTMDRLHQAGIRVALATPSAAPPHWLTRMHPDILLVDKQRRRVHHSGRQATCPTAPLYRRHVARINQAIAQRYKGHPALALWHISNEYAQHCWCDLCVTAFRVWLKKRYGDLDTLNQQWWTAFWSQRFTAWEQIEPHWDLNWQYIHGLRLDWQRFQSHQVCDFFKHEVATVRQATPTTPVTTNLMGFYEGLNYAPFADAMDVVSWDCYADVGDDGAYPAFSHAFMRGLKEGQPWLLLEQSPSATNWQKYGELKPPGVLRLWSWQAVGHGSDAVMYFQWRRSRGSFEKFHGAVVEHAGSVQSRVFQEVAALGAELQKAGPQIVGAAARSARVGILWDQENRWALEACAGYGQDKNPVQFAGKHYAAFWRQNIPVDVVRLDADWSRYDILVAPMLYMVRSGQFPQDGSAQELRGKIDEAKKIARWTAAGGTFVTTTLSGIVNENDLVYEGGYPGPLRKLLGIWVEEIDNPRPEKARNKMVLVKGALPGMKPAYACERYFDQIHPEGAQVLARFGGNWYADRPCVTCQRVGTGRAYYLGTDAGADFLRDFYRRLAADKGITPLVKPTAGVEVLERVGGHFRGNFQGRGQRLLFFLNHSEKARSVSLGKTSGVDVLTGKKVAKTSRLAPYGVQIIAVRMI